MHYLDLCYSLASYIADNTTSVLYFHYAIYTSSRSNQYPVTKLAHTDCVWPVYTCLVLFGN